MGKGLVDCAALPSASAPVAHPGPALGQGRGDPGEGSRRCSGDPFFSSVTSRGPFSSVTSVCLTEGDDITQDTFKV